MAIIRIVPNKLDFIPLLCSIASFVAVKMLYPDVFRGSSFWVNCGYLAAIVGVLAVGVYLWQSWKKTQFMSVMPLLSMVLAIYGFWLVQDATNPDTRFKKIKQGYLKKIATNDLYGITDFVSWDIKLDFFESSVASRLRGDRALIDSLMKDLALQEKWSDLGRGLYYDYYGDQAVVCYLSLREQGLSQEQILELPNGLSLFTALLFRQLNQHNYYSSNPQKLTEMLPLLPQNMSEMAMQATLRQVDKLNELNYYELEMLLYLFSQVPVVISDDTFRQLMVKWKGFKPTYQKDIDEFITARNSLRSYIKSKGLEHQPIIGLTFEGKSVMTDPKVQESYLQKIKPFLNLTGYAFYLGDDIRLELGMKSEFLIERRKAIYKDVEKTRQVRSSQRVGNTYQYRTRTEKYTESEYAGTKSDNIYQRNLSLALPVASPNNELFSLSEYLPHQFFDKEKGDYTIPYQEMSRRECWVLALPQSWYCLGCNDY